MVDLLPLRYCDYSVLPYYTLFSIDFKLIMTFNIKNRKTPGIVALRPTFRVFPGSNISN